MIFATGLAPSMVVLSGAALILLHQWADDLDPGRLGIRIPFLVAAAWPRQEHRAPLCDARLCPRDDC